jgi:hypothetical protein
MLKKHDIITLNDEIKKKIIFIENVVFWMKYLIWKTSFFLYKKNNHISLFCMHSKKKKGMITRRKLFKTFTIKI